MAQLREVRRRIQSVKNTQQVTRAMKMVAAAKLRKSQIAALQARPYADHIEKVINILLTGELPEDNVLLQGQESDKVHLVAIAGDRGLCGGFNINILKKVQEVLDGCNCNIECTVLGKKAFEFFQKHGIEVTGKYQDLDDRDLIELSREISSHVVSRFTEGHCRSVELVYSEFESVISQRIVHRPVLPLTTPWLEDDHEKPEIIYHPSNEMVFERLLPRYLLTIFHHAILESLASIHGARMTAMDMATRNAGELISQLTQEYNQARQAAITRELIEIVSGADALNH